MPHDELHERAPADAAARVPPEAPKRARGEVVRDASPPSRRRPRTARRRRRAPAAAARAAHLEKPRTTRGCRPNLNRHPLASPPFAAPTRHHARHAQTQILQLVILEQAPLLVLERHPVRGVAQLRGERRRRRLGAEERGGSSAPRSRRPPRTRARRAVSRSPPPPPPPAPRGPPRGRGPRTRRLPSARAGGKDPARFAAHGASASASRESFGDAIAACARSCVSPSPTGESGVRAEKPRKRFFRRTRHDLRWTDSRIGVYFAQSSANDQLIGEIQGL